ncbi:MAG: hypothetical protein J5833_09080 [Victivallales bacterium]|nr:hypothetical protein [Victivallales bacterium]
MKTTLDIFSITDRQSCQAPEDNGLVNGRIAVNSWLPDVCEIRDIYAPPHFSSNFRIAVRFNDRQATTSHWIWRPDCLTRMAVLGSFRIRTELVLLKEQPVALMRTAVTNATCSPKTLRVEFEVYGGVCKWPHWRFGHPVETPYKQYAEKEWDGKRLRLHNEYGEILVGSTLRMVPREPVRTGVLESSEMELASGGTVEFWTCIALGEAGANDGIFKAPLRNPEQCKTEAEQWWQSRLERLFQQMPSLQSDNSSLVKYYNRSLLHLLMNEWNVPSFHLHPHYGTGCISGDTICCYMWNYGGPCRMWSILNPKSAKEHLLHLLSLDLCHCYAFFADDGAGFGPYYQINHEKVIFLAYYYVMQTRDTAILKKVVNGKTVIELLVEHALMHDDISKPATMVDYGPANDHLELRSPTIGTDPTMRYNGVMPDLNLRRIPLMHLVDSLCRLAKHKPPVDLLQRAADLKTLLHRELFSKKEGWFKCLSAEGLTIFRYTVQMFKALGWGDWVFEPEAEKALVKHLMSEKEFLGPFGVHSLSKTDPAYYEGDVDNGGPGSCVSFPAAIIERLYRSGRIKEAENILARLLWMGDSLAYWGDSQRADVKDYRRISHLQCDIEGAVPAQAIIFGMFGIEINPDFSVSVSPHLYPNTRRMALRNVRLAGMVFDVQCTEKGFVVVCNGRRHAHAYGETCILS